MKQSFCIDNDLAGKTIKQYFELQGYSTTQIKRFKYDGHILANGSQVTVRYLLKFGDKVEIATNDRLLTPSFAQQKAQVLFCDNYLYVANKPYGVAIHPDLAHHDQTFGNMLATTFGKGFELRIVTRLDKTTNGLVLGALDEVTCQRLNDMQQKHQIQKVYFAKVEGHLQGAGQIALPLLRQNNKTIVDEKGKEALTFFEEIAFDGIFTTVKLTLGTGRTHQLRAHLSAVGHPIAGDKLYGAVTCGEVQLTCKELHFDHPVTQKRMDVVLS